MAESIPIETLKITVTSSGAGQVRKNLEEVAAGLKAVRDSVKGGTDQVGNIVERLKLLISAISDLDGDKVDKLARLGDALSKLKAGTVGSSSEAVFNKIANGIKTISDAAKDIKNLEALERLADVLERLKAVGFIKMGISGTKSVAKAAKEAEDAGIGTGDGGAGGEADQLDPEKLKQLKKDLKEADSILAGLKNKYLGWIKAITRIALYRAIRSLIKGIMQSLNDGLEHFYQYSLKVNGLYATARAEIKTSMHYVSDALGAAAGQLIEKIYPVVVRILDATAEIFNNISEMIAYLSGEETYTRAVRGVADVNAEAKKLKATILGFDEINKLNGSNGSGDDEYGHFEEALVDKKRAKITSAIVESISAIFVGSKVLSLAQDFQKLARALGVKGVAGAALEASGNFGGLSDGFDTASSSASGFANALEKVADGVIAVAGAVTTFKAGEKVGKGKGTPGTKIQGAGGILATTLAGAKLGGVPGAILGAMGGTLAGIAGLVKGEIDNGYFKRHEKSVNSAWDLLGGAQLAQLQGFSSLAEKEGIRMSGEAVDEIADINNKLAGVSPTAPYSDAYKQDKIASMFPGMPPIPTDGGLWDGTNGVAVTSGTTTQVTVELDGDVLATAMAGAGHRIDRRGSNRDELR